MDSYGINQGICRGKFDNHWYRWMIFFQNIEFLFLFRIGPYIINSDLVFLHFLLWHNGFARNSDRGIDAFPVPIAASIISSHIVHRKYTVRLVSWLTLAPKTLVNTRILIENHNFSLLLLEGKLKNLIKIS